MSSVIDTLECPSISETIFGWTPFVSNRVAQVCLRSWKRMSGSPARLSSGVKWRGAGVGAAFRWEEGGAGVPEVVEAYVGQPGAPEQRLEVAGHEVGVVGVPAEGVRE